MVIHEYKLIEIEEAHSLRDKLDLLDDAYYIDRSVPVSYTHLTLPTIVLV